MRPVYRNYFWESLQLYLQYLLIYVRMHQTIKEAKAALIQEKNAKRTSK